MALLSSMRVRWVDLGVSSCATSVIISMDRVKSVYSKQGFQKTTDKTQFSDFVEEESATRK
jgi:hypothetical protein